MCRDRHDAAMGIGRCGWAGYGRVWAVGRVAGWRVGRGVSEHNEGFIYEGRRGRAPWRAREGAGTVSKYPKGVL